MLTMVFWNSVVVTASDAMFIIPVSANTSATVRLSSTRLPSSPPLPATLRRSRSDTCAEALLMPECADPRLPTEPGTRAPPPGSAVPPPPPPLAPPSAPSLRGTS